MIPFGELPVDAELHRDMLDTADRLRRRTGADLCHWNGTIDVHPLQDHEGDPAALGKAHWNGTISLREDVLHALRNLWHRSPRAWSIEDRARHRPAVLTVAHELIHYLVPDGEAYSKGKPIYDEFPGRALEEGSTELAGRNHVGEFAAAEARSPGVTDARNARSYPQFAPAVQALIRYVSDLRGESEDAVLNALVRENVPGKFRRLGQMVLEAGGAWGQIPSAERDGACAEVINAAWGALQANRDWAAPKPRYRTTQAPAERSWIMGLQLIGAIERARLRAIDRHAAGRAETPWQVAAARYERYVARRAVEFAQSSGHPDVRAAADALMRRAEQRMQNPWQEPEREGVERDYGTNQVAPEVAVVPSLSEPPRSARPRRPRQLGVRRRPAPPDRGVER